MKNKITELMAKYEEIILYLFWGVMTTVVSWGSYAIFARYADFPVLFANAMSWLFATLFAFFTNKFFVFKSRSMRLKLVLRELTLFVSTRLGTGAFELAAVPLLVWIGMDQTVLGVKGALAKIVASFTVVIMNYVFSKKMIFTRKS